MFENEEELTRSILAESADVHHNLAVRCEDIGDYVSLLKHREAEHILREAEEKIYFVFQR
jgi:hypothetical protein